MSGRRVAVITPVYTPYRAGMARVAEEDVKMLISIGVEVGVYTPRLLRPVFSYGNAAFVPQIFDVARRHDVIMLHYPFFGGAGWAALGAWFFRKPLVVIFHMDAQAGDWRDVVFRVYRWLVQPFVFLVAKQIIVSSLDYAKESSIGKRFMDKVVEVPLSVPTEVFVPLQKDERDSVLKVVLFVGALDAAHRFKGLSELFRAMVKIRDARLVVCGGGNLLEEYRIEAEKLGIDERVVFVGRVSDEELVKQYQHADVVAFPSTSGAEAFGLVVAEAMSCGVPVVASALPGVRSVVNDSVNGILVPPGDVEALAAGLRKLLGDDSLRALFGVAARKKVEEKYSVAARQRMLMSFL